MLSRDNLDSWKRLVEQTRKAAFDEFGAQNSNRIADFTFRPLE